MYRAFLLEGSLFISSSEYFFYSTHRKIETQRCVAYKRIVVWC